MEILDQEARLSDGVVELGKHFVQQHSTLSVATQLEVRV